MNLWAWSKLTGTKAGLTSWWFDVRSNNKRRNHTEVLSIGAFRGSICPQKTDPLCSVNLCTEIEIAGIESPGQCSMREVGSMIRGSCSQIAREYQC